MGERRPRPFYLPTVVNLLAGETIPLEGYASIGSKLYARQPMADTPGRESLLLILANLDQQMADAAALMAELGEGSPDYEAASEWLAETTAESALVSKLLAQANDANHP